MLPPPACGKEAARNIYDTGGNILTASDGITTHTYTYGGSSWKDLLTAYDGHAITYDNGGNPLSYYNGSNWTFDWVDGRKLNSVTDANGTVTSYVYDVDGTRRSKTVGGVACAEGTVYADDFQLEKGEAPSNVNLLTNGDMGISG